AARKESAGAADHYPSRPDRSTRRTFPVTALVGQGLTNEQIARSLVVTIATVKTHLNRVMSKLGLASRAQAVVIAYESGLISPGHTCHGYPVS
ncbi:response regulator transcription factor, partial [Streptomyces sp. NPDC001272]